MNTKFLADYLHNDTSEYNVNWTLDESGTWPPPQSSTSSFPHQSKYNWPVLLMFIVIFGAIGGNLLVCLAVRQEPKLRNMFNYFLVSLAMSDLLSATLVMPVTIIKAFIGELQEPKHMCQAWYALDVLFTSSTIMHLTVISIDRYMALKFPLKYGAARRTRHTVFKIMLVWILAFSLAGPLFYGTMFVSDNREDGEDLTFKGCGPENPSFILPAVVISFFLPLLIMGVMYVLTVLTLHKQSLKQARLQLKKITHHARRDDSMYSLTSDVTNSQNNNHRSVSADGSRYLSPTHALRNQGSGRSAKSLNIPLLKRNSFTKVTTTTTTDSGFNESESNAVPLKQMLVLSSTSTTVTDVNNPRCSITSTKPSSSSTNTNGVRANSTPRCVSFAAPSNKKCKNKASSLKSSSRKQKSRTNSNSSNASFNSTSSGGNSSGNSISDENNTMEEEDTPSNSPVHSSAPIATARNTSFIQRIKYRLSRRNTTRGSQRYVYSQDRGRKAVKVLGVLFVVFVICYLPFFLTYTISGMCGNRCARGITPALLQAFEWLGYSGSMINPIVYHVFSKEFRVVFKRLLRCRSCSKRR